MRLKMYNRRLRKSALILVGTGQFDELIGASMKEDVLNQLINYEYCKMNIQVGLESKAIEYYLRHLTTRVPARIEADSATVWWGADKRIKINIFRYNRDLDGLIRCSDVIITHGGAGSIINCLRHAKKIIVSPNHRLQNDHQQDLVERLLVDNYVTVCRDLSHLRDFIDIIEKSELRKFPDQATELIPNLISKLLPE